MTAPSEDPQRPQLSLVDAAWYGLTLVALAVLLSFETPALWPFPVALLIGASLVGAWWWMGWDLDRVASVRDVTTGLTAAGTFFAAYSAQIGRIEQGGAVLIGVIPLSIAALRSATRLRKEERFQADAQELDRRQREERRHAEVLALLDEWRRERQAPPARQRGQWLGSLARCAWSRVPRSRREDG